MDPGKDREAAWSQLMRKAQDADREAYTQLLRELSAYLHAFLKVKFRDPGLCDDLVQEILVAVHKARHTFEADRPFLPWIHAIVRFKSADLLRKMYKDRRLDPIEDDAEFPETFSFSTANEDLDDALTGALQKLPDKQRIVVTLLKLDGLSVKEAALKTGMSEAAVKVTAHRAYKAMRKSLAGGKDEA